MLVSAIELNTLALSCSNVLGYFFSLNFFTILQFRCNCFLRSRLLNYLCAIRLLKLIIIVRIAVVSSVHCQVATHTV